MAKTETNTPTPEEVTKEQTNSEEAYDIVFVQYGQGRNPEKVPCISKAAALNFLEVMLNSFTHGQYSIFVKLQTMQKAATTENATETCFDNVLTIPDYFINLELKDFGVQISPATSETSDKEAE